MNERIKELEYQCWEDKSPEWAENFHMVFNIEKFAELIVQDIINTALFKARWYQEVEKDASPEIALCDLVKDIREEYGVE